MTSEAPHRPGQEPGEVPPGAGGPAPYGDRTAHQDNGYPGAPDLGWAPPPPAGRPQPPQPAWAQDEQAATPAWDAQGDQPATAVWGAAQVPQQGEPGGWQQPPAPQNWTPPQEQGGPAWAAGPPAEQGPPAWRGPHEQQPGPGWAAPEQPQANWAQQGETTGARGAAQVPAPPHDDPARSGGWQPTPAPHDDRSGGWSVGAAAQPPEPPAQPGGWGGDGSPRDEQPGWAQQGEQAGWHPAGEPAARGAAQVPAPAGQPHDAWGTPPQQDDPARSGGWQAGPPARQDASEPDRGWAAPQQDESVRSGGWEAAAATDDPDRSGGWAAGRAAARVEQQPAWGTPDNPPADDWHGAPQRQDRPAPDWAAQEEPARPGWGAAPAPTAGDRPEAESWTPPARASASVPTPDGPPAWGAAPKADAPQWTPADRPAVPEGEPWSPDEVWGRAGEAQAAPDRSHGWEQDRAEEPPAYQPSLGPGITPGNAVPLPPQEQRVPGASLAAAPPADYPPAQFGPPAEPEHGNTPHGYEPAQQHGWGAAEPAHEEPQSPAGPVVPAPRTSPESGAGGRASVPAPSGEAGSVTASASVPTASRVVPPTDQPLRPGGTPAPQPRVYGRPARPEPEEAPEQDGPDGGGYPEPHRFDEPAPQRYDDQGPQQRYDEHDRPGAQHGFAEAPPVSSAPPSGPAGPPPFPPGVPSFMEPAGNTRPANGVHPHSGDRPADPFGGPDRFGGPNGPGDPFGAPGRPADSFGGPGDPFGAPGGDRAPGGPGEYGGPAGRASVGTAPGQAQVPGGFPPAPQSAPPAWPQQGAPGESEQGRFDQFKPEAEPKTEAPAPKVRNGKVLALVLIAAVLILAVPLGLLTLLGKVGGDKKPAAFDPPVGSCVKQSGETAVAVDCAEQGAFTVVSKVDAKEKCADPAQPQVMLQGDMPNKILCLKPAAAK